MAAKEYQLHLVVSEYDFSQRTVMLIKVNLGSPSPWTGESGAVDVFRQIFAYNERQVSPFNQFDGDG